MKHVFYLVHLLKGSESKEGIGGPLSLADLGGMRVVRGTGALSVPNIFHFHAIFGKNYPN